MFITVDRLQYHPRRVFCIGCNYAAHVRELHDDDDAPPVVFMKPCESLVPPGGAIVPPPGYKGALDYEAELVVMIGAPGRIRREKDAPAAIQALGVGCDLTLRTLQGELRKKGAPWECCKAFEHSAPLGELHSFDPACDRLNDLEFTGSVNGVERQRGNSKDMIYSIPRLLVELSQYWVLQPGDLVFTGTPPGVGPLAPGDTLRLTDHRGQTFFWSMQNEQ